MSTKTGQKQYDWVQCQRCGYKYRVDYYGGVKKLPSEASIVSVVCPSCGGCHGINCGSNIDDYYYFCDPVMDARYY